MAKTRQTNQYRQKGQRLTARERLFVVEYLVDRNATAAAKRAGYSQVSAKQTAHAMLQKPHIAKEVEKRLKSLLSGPEQTAERIILEAHRIALADPRQLFTEDGMLKDVKDLDPDIAACIASIELGEKPKVRLNDKVAALRMLFQYRGLLKELVEVKGTLTLEQLLAGTHDTEEQAK